MLSKITQYAIRLNFFLVLCIFSRKRETNVLFYGIIEPTTYMCASIKDKKNQWTLGGYHGIIHPYTQCHRLLHVGPAAHHAARRHGYLPDHPPEAPAGLPPAEGAQADLQGTEQRPR